MKKTKKYERAELELIYFEEKDIITTSTTEETEGGWDFDGWT